MRRAWCKVRSLEHRNTTIQLGSTGVYSRAHIHSTSALIDPFVSLYGLSHWLYKIIEQVPTGIWNSATKLYILKRPYPRAKSHSLHGFLEVALLDWVEKATPLWSAPVAMMILKNHYHCHTEWCHIFSYHCPLLWLAFMDNGHDARVEMTDISPLNINDQWISMVHKFIKYQLIPTSEMISSVYIHVYTIYIYISLIYH